MQRFADISGIQSNTPAYYTPALEQIFEKTRQNSFHATAENGFVVKIPMFLTIRVQRFLVIPFKTLTLKEKMRFPSFSVTHHAVLQKLPSGRQMVQGLPKQLGEAGAP